jgi:hypothetical protein
VDEAVDGGSHAKLTTTVPKSGLGSHGHP